MTQADVMEFANMNQHGRVSAVPRLYTTYEEFDAIRKLLAESDQEHVNRKSRFASRLALHFPAVAARLDEGDFGILPLEIGTLTLAARVAIQDSDWNALARYFAFVSYMFEGAGLELRHAISVAFLGNLFYGEMDSGYTLARCMLPMPLVNALNNVEQHYEDLVP